ncbi:MAG: pyruvate, phosphate dikinase [Planctomycetota bacterium]|nr:MAG: pyruvate, phosphate dikinase [Planctomycetota bacterium]
MPKLVYSFGDGQAEGTLADRPRLGGKGAGLHEMTRLGVPVPPGFTISAEVCQHFEQQGRLPAELQPQVEEALELLGRRMGRRFGDPQAPLLVSVRSGAAVSMPGMMDTVLNLGLCDAALAGLAALGGGRRFALDAYRRLIAMFGNVVKGVAHERFERALAEARARAGARTDAELDEQALAALVETYQTIYREAVGEPFPQDPHAQLWEAIRAVLRSWNNERARTYRRLHRIEGLLGTAVNVQAMVFGNTGPHSATGVCFTRNPATGEDVLYGEYLPNAQGEDVVAGLRTPEPIARLQQQMPDRYRELLELKALLERHFRDMQDIEFTIEDGRLYVLQTRAGKRTGPAALRIATEMVEQGLLSPREAVRRVEPAHLEQLLFPTLEPAAARRAREQGRLLARGLNAAPGVAVGTVVFEPEEAEAAAAHGARVILVRPETSPEDIGGMAAAQGILTSTGGITSHAAVVARGMGKPCVAGCSAIEIDLERQCFRAGAHTVHKGEVVSIDGSTGEVYLGALPTSQSELVRVLLERELEPEQAPLYQRFARFMEWVDQARRLRVRANADTPEDARVALAFGAEGIGLCRTEHMFFEPERIPLMRAMILAETEAEQRAALARVEPHQRDDFVAIFTAMGERPVTIRLLDPPLHEFLPKEPEQQQALAQELGLDPERVRAKVQQLQEFNPMLGHRGCRLGITHPEIYAMQVRAIVEAALEVAARGLRVRPEIMVPLVGSAAELALVRSRIEAIIAQRRAALREQGIEPPVEFAIGTMIELPRACLLAEEIAQHADFFSFGTNDLTQCTWGLSRDDGQSFLPRYQEEGLLPVDPFQVLDRPGVGALMRLAVEGGRRARAELHLGICGEHGGEPASVAFCHELGLDYVSCSPYRIPIARLAAAQAALAGEPQLRAE